MIVEEPQLYADHYKTILADPPWRYDSGPGRRAAADKHYITMSNEELVEYGEFVKAIAHPDGSHLWLWTTNSMLVEGTALEICKAWDHTPVTLVTWVKGRVETTLVDDARIAVARSFVALKILRSAMGDKKKMKKAAKALLDLMGVHIRYTIGLGQYTRGATEHMILATRGKKRVGERPKKAVPNVFAAWPGKHSAKPLEQYALIERVSPGPYAELFARNRHVGWDATGLELEAAE